MSDQIITDAGTPLNMGESKPVPAVAEIKSNPDINFFGLTNYRNQYRKFGIKLDDRRRHMYVVGKTGMGKTTLLENMVLNDIYAGHGVGLVDPHGDYAEKIINFVPSWRINDIVYFNPADVDYPIGFNILETIRPDQKHLVASGLMGVFKKIWPDVWSARMEYILNNTILALLDFPGTTLLGINRLLADEAYRKRVVQNLKDPVVKAFWQTEFDSYNDKYKQEAVAPIQNKIGQFLSASVIRNIVAQVKSRINIRDIMDNRKIFIMNLSKGRIGEDNSRLLGGMLITKIQLAAMERVDTPEAERKDFFLYVDEFQNFATESFANILSEARKYRLGLIMAHQYMEQLEEEVMAAVIGNVGTTVTFRVGSTDAEILAKEFIPTFIEDDLINLPKYHIYLKLMIDGVSSRPFSSLTLPPIGSPTGSAEKVIKVSRERYAIARDRIEDKIARWSGMTIVAGEELENMDLGEDTYEEQMAKAIVQAAETAPVSTQAVVIAEKPIVVQPKPIPVVAAPPIVVLQKSVPRPATPPASAKIVYNKPQNNPYGARGGQPAPGGDRPGKNRGRNRNRGKDRPGNPHGGGGGVIQQPKPKPFDANRALPAPANEPKLPPQAKELKLGTPVPNKSLPAPAVEPTLPPPASKSLLNNENSPDPKVIKPGQVIQLN
ncbi:MAG: type IV secretion system DNA-binding domain-containing protein [bacterium]|nr:type IV secretion system DNA-binding domain-containing protein [bacterium]